MCICTVYLIKTYQFVWVSHVECSAVESELSSDSSDSQESSHWSQASCWCLWSCTGMSKSTAGERRNPSAWGVLWCHILHYHWSERCSLTCRRWRWSSVCESCSSSVFLIFSSVISCSRSSMSSCSCFSAAFCCCSSIISSTSVWHLSMERMRSVKSSTRSAFSFSVFLCSTGSQSTNY